MRFILHYMKKYKGLLILNLISVFGFALVELGIPTIIAQMIDIGIMQDDMNYVYQMGAVMVIISIVGVSLTILLGYCCAKISSGITRDIRNDIFDKAQEFTAHEYNRFGTSSMITRTNNDAYQIQMFVNVLLRTALVTPIMFIGSFVMTARASWQLSLVIAATIPIIIIGVVLVAKYSQPISEKQQASLDGINRISHENLSGIRVIRSFDNDAYEQKRFNEGNEAFTRYSKRIFKLMSMTSPIFFFLMNIAAIGIFVVAAFLLQKEMLEIGQLVAFMDYLFHAMFSIMLFCTIFMMYPRAQVSAMRIKEIFDTKPIIDNPKDGKQTGGEEKGSIVFDHVTFVYPDGEEPVLHDVSFQAKQGETIAFIGSTGSGKSTLVNLIPRFYDITEGSIRIDGVDVRDYDVFALRNKLGVIPQKANLFSGTIRDNICFGYMNASEKELIHAAKTAQAYEFITSKEKGFEEEISEGATNVSGGQKQRLSIARALIKRPNIYIFDDSFSALDYKTDAQLRKALKKETKESIVMVVAQRISSIMEADRIVVLNEGYVVGMGTHKELLKNCQIYHEIALSQLSEEELAYE